MVLTDFQNLGAGHLASVDRLMIALAKSFADQLELDTDPGQMWDADLGPGINLERYLRRGVFKQITTPIVWGLDEVDRLFTCDFGSESLVSSGRGTTSALLTPMDRGRSLPRHCICD
jgi:hypothetical protein